MASVGERPRGSAVPSAVVEEPLAGWRLAAFADRSKRPKSSPWQVPAEMELRVLPCDNGIERPGSRPKAFDGCDVQTRPSKTGSRRDVYERPDSRSPSGS